MRDEKLAQGVTDGGIAWYGVRSVMALTLNRVLFQPEAKEYIFAFARQRVKRRAIDHLAPPPGIFHTTEVLMDLKLHGKTALVTGASAGIGAAIAKALAAEGVRVAISARRLDKLGETAAAIKAAGGPDPVVLESDLYAADAAASLATRAVNALGGVDILVNNAGGSRPFSQLHVGEAQWVEAMTLNFDRPRQLADALIDQMIARNWGRIINITGKSEPDHVNGAFCAKAAVHSWAKGLSRMVGKHGITVNCIPPGRIHSEQILRNYTPEYRKWQSENEIPVGRYGEPEELAVLAVWLASPLAGYISGTVIPVDGGLRRYQF